MNVFSKGILSQAAKAVRGGLIYPAKNLPSRIDGLGGGLVPERVS